MDKKEAMKEVPPEKAFYLANGKVLKSVNALKEELKVMPDQLFKVHVTNEKNDFANWIKYVFNDEKLCQDMLKTKDRMVIAKLIEEDIKHKEDLARIDEIINAKPEKKPEVAVKLKEEPKKVIKHKKVIHHESRPHHAKDDKKIFLTALIQGIVIGIVAALLLAFMLMRYSNLCS